MKYFLTLLIGTTLLAAETKKEEQPVVLNKMTEAVKIYPDGKLELLNKASWEDAAYAILAAARELELRGQACVKELEKKKK